MDNREAVNWLINISADIGKAEHSDLWHYEQALTEIKDMLESAQLSQEGATTDTISTVSYIDLLKQMRKDGDMVPWEGKDVFARIRKLPSAQPEERTETHAETRACD